MIEGVVDAATAKFTSLEQQQARNQQELTQGVRLQKQSLMKSKVSSTTLQKAFLLRLQTWLSESNNIKIMLEGLRNKIRFECLK